MLLPIPGLSPRSFVLSAVMLGSVASHGWCDDGFPHSFADLADKVKPAVVNISTTTNLAMPERRSRPFGGSEGQGGALEDFFRRFFEDFPEDGMKQQSLGSGFIIDRDGHILTNNHMVEKADEIRVKLADGRELKAKVTGRDSKSDLALLKITTPAEKLPFLQWGDSEKMRVGDWVLAVGNPFGLGNTVTQGIISATGREIGAGNYDYFLQTDAPINPGNSGGPLVNLKGEVVGINTAIVSVGQGLGFAIPSAMAKTIVTQLREKGKVVRGWIGVSIQPVTPDIATSFGLKEPTGALVGDVESGGPADVGGIRRGDIITSFGGKKVKNFNDLPRFVAETPQGKQTEVIVLRNGKDERMTVKVGELKDEKKEPEREAGVTSLGMQLDNLTPAVREQHGIKEKTGVVVVGVAPGGDAVEAGLQPGDLIKEVNRVPVNNLEDYHSAMAKVKKGQPALLLVKRGNRTLFTTIEMPEDK